MSDVFNRFIYGVIINDAPDMYELYEDIAEYAGSMERIDWQSDVMYGDVPTQIIVGTDASVTFENFGQVNIDILVECKERAAAEFHKHSAELIEFLKSHGAEVSTPGLYNFSYVN